MKINRQLYKQALEVAEPGVVSNIISKSLGRWTNIKAIAPLLLGGTRVLRDPDSLPGSLKKHKRIARLMESAEPGALKNTIIRFGAPDLIDDAIWKKKRKGEEDLKWYQRIGGRAWHNPNTTLPYKLLTYPSIPAAWLASSILRSPHYNDVTDAAHVMWDMPEVTSHELGHAIDLNKPALNSEGKLDKNYFKRLGRRTFRDLYSTAYAFPPGTLILEWMANRQSRNALKKTMSPEEYREFMKARSRVLPAAYGTYLGAALAKYLPIPAPASVLGGMAAGHLAGQTRAAIMAYNDRKRKEQEKQKTVKLPEQKDEKKKKKRAA